MGLFTVVTDNQIFGKDTEINLNIALKGINEPIIAFEVSLEYSSFLLSLVAVKSDISTLAMKPNKITLGSLTAIELPDSSYIATLKFKTLVDVTGIPFSIAVHSLKIGTKAGDIMEPEYRINSLFNFPSIQFGG